MPINVVSAAHCTVSRQNAIVDFAELICCNRCLLQKLCVEMRQLLEDHRCSKCNYYISLQYIPAVRVYAEYAVMNIQCESKKIPPEALSQFFQNGGEFFDQISQACYVFRSTLEYEFLFNYLQL